jgi:hypothetical protein
MYSSYLKKSRTSFILDKYPEMIFRIGLLNAVFRNPKYILLHRDAFDTVSSTAAWSQQHSGNNEDWWGVNKRKWKLLIEQVLPGSALLKEHIPVISEFTAGPDMAAVEWIVTMEYGIKMLQQFPDKILPVSYEALCTSPEIALEKISAFAGWSPDEKMKQYAKRVLKNLPAKTKPVMHDILYEPISKLTRELEICS